MSRSVTANTICRKSPRTKTGIATPMFAPTIETTSVGELRRSAEAIPSGIPTTVANSIARIVSSIVTGIRSTTMSTTGRLKRIGIVEVTVEDAVVAAAEDGRQQVQASALRHDRSLAAEDTEVDPELDRDRLVQPVALGERGAQLRRGLLTVRGDARVARDDAAEHEHEEDDPEQHDDA